MDLMNYHEFGKAKYVQLGMDYEVDASAVRGAACGDHCGIFRYGIKTQIGG